MDLWTSILTEQADGLGSALAARNHRRSAARERPERVFPSPLWL